MKAKLVDRKENGRKTYLTFEVELLSDIPEGDLDVTIKKWKSPRSREALNYSWQIITEMAEKLSVESPITKDELYHRMVNDYGILERDEENQLVKIVLKCGVDAENLDVYLHMTPHTTMIGETMYRLYYLVKPPHEYNSREFAQFLDHIKAEARGIGVEI